MTNEMISENKENSLHIEPRSLFNGEKRTFSWVITAESESERYEKEYKSYLREMFARRPDTGMPGGAGKHPSND